MGILSPNKIKNVGFKMIVVLEKEKRKKRSL